MLEGWQVSQNVLSFGQLRNASCEIKITVR